MPPVPIKLGGTGAATLAAAKTALGITGGSGAVPAPTTTTLGGVFAKSAPTGQVQTGIDTTGSPTFAVPPAGAAPTFTGDVTNGAGTTVLALAAVVTADTIGSATVIPRISYDAKGRITGVTAQDAGAVMDQKDNASANAAAMTAVTASNNYTNANAVGSVRMSGGNDIVCNVDAGIQNVPSGCVVVGFGAFSGPVFYIRYKQLQYVTVGGAVGNASTS